MQTFPRAVLRQWRRIALAAAAIGVAGLAHAENPSMLNDFDYAKPAFIHQQPFAHAKLVIQVSQDDPAIWALALNNAENAAEFFGQEKVQVVVVAYGPGLRMLLKGSPVAERIAGQDAEGIEFDACHNTMMGMAKKTGHMPEVVPQAVIVPAGVVRIMQLEQAGFPYIKP